MDEHEENINEIEENAVPEEYEDDVPAEIIVNKTKRQRLVRKGRMKQERFRAVMRFFITVLFLLGLVYGLKSSGWYMDKNAFNRVDSSSVEIINNKIVPSHKILMLLKNNSVPNVPIYMARTGAIKKELLKLAPVENVYIRRYAFPARMQIILRERTPVITIYPDIKLPPVAFFTSDGKLIGKEFLPLDKSYKTITVLSYGNKGDDYNKWNLKKIKEIQKIVKYVETYSKEDVEFIDFRNPKDVYIKIKTVNIRLGKIDDTLFKRIERIPSILPQVKDVKSKIKYLDLSWEKVNYLKLE